MKKIICAALGLTVLSGCASYETNMDKSQETRAEQRHQIQMEQGCLGLDEHTAFRKCVIDTFYRTHKMPYTASTLPGGRPVIIIRKAPQAPIVKQIITTKSIETSAPVVQEPIPVFMETVVVKEPQPAIYVMETVEPQKTIILEATQVQPTKEQTWWETYQATKQPEPKKSVQCPCKDPNAPCPECTPK